MSRSSVELVLQGLPKRESKTEKMKYVTDSYVPKAHGISVVEKLKEPSRYEKKKVTYF